MLDHALLYARRGWNVFPCKANNKIPLTGTGFRAAVKEEAAVRELFKPHPKCNIGIATGKVSGFFVLDIDVKNDAGGDESLHELEQQFGKLPDTVEAITWSGGRHLLFKYPEGGIGNRTKVRPGIDVRGDGGYIIAAPSVIEGKEYVWEAEHHPDNIDIVDAPEWLMNLLRSEHAPAQPAQDDATVEKITAGARNDTLFKKGIALRKLGLPHETVLQGLKDLNRAKCSPPLSEKEIIGIAASAAKADPEKKQPVNFTKEPYTDVWNAKMFHDNCGDSIRFCDALGGWHVWDGSKWIKDHFQIVALAKNTVKRMYESATESSDKALYRHAERTESENKLRSMVNLVRDHAGVSLNSDDFDKNLYLINCINGTLDLETEKMTPHLPINHITKQIQLAYNPAATCPTWTKFIESIFMGNAETIRFVHKAVGYSLSGSIAEQCMFILYGVGSNGKSTFLETISKVFGDYSMTTLAATIMEKQNNGIPNDVARLKGARFVNALETDENKKLAESVIKTLTGGDKIVARFLNKEFFEFHATFKLFLATNHKPRISGTDNGIWRRIRYIPFNKIIAPEERDKSLPEKLLAEQEGILAWAVKGFKLWQAEGLGSCPEIDEATREYREESDILQEYIADRCIVAEGEEVQSSMLYKNLSDWCKDMGIYRISRAKIIEYLESKKFDKKMMTAGPQRGSMFWRGIGLKLGSESLYAESLLGNLEDSQDAFGRPF
jgi:putative DNA primase/helicase